MSFHYRDNQLHCERVALDLLAERFETPLYVYSRQDVEGRLRAFDRAFRGVPHTICYSVKANSNLTLLRLLAKSGAGFDVVSGGELARARTAAKSAVKKVVFSGVGKTEDEMKAALQAGIMLFNVESEQELDALDRVTARMKKKARIAFRVNPHVSAETHPYISTGLHEHKFGVPISEALMLYARAATMKWLEPAGVSVHIGSQINQLSAFRETMTRVAGLIRELAAMKIKIQMLDAGGGLGIDYQKNESVEEFGARAQQYAQAVLEPLQGLKLHLILEPGRSVVARCGALITRVVYIKQNGGKRFAVVDAAMNDLIRPSLYQAQHRIVPVVQEDRGEWKYDVVGPICETGDFFARDRNLQGLEAGDLVAILDTGAYGMSLASNYNSRPRAAEVLVDGSRAKVIRRRETMKDLFAAER